ncbi:MAG: hypothetical protein J6W37_01260 [Bacteroidales bacterium]|nr:hypothetical protein [Bacteroidales bacterium]
MAKEKIRIDGIESLINELGGNENEFVKLAINASYFFDNKLVNQRNNDILDAIKKNEALPARISIGKGNYNNTLPEKGDKCDFKINGEPIIIKNDNGEEKRENILIKIDKDNNEEVRRYINKETGYTIAQGRKNSIFQNYNISHIWGNAFDPRYFTSLWNIVFIPSWANSLMDKPSCPIGSLESKMKNTYKTICKKMYFENKEMKDWLKNISLENLANEDLEEADIVKGTYKIHIIKGKENKKRVSFEREDTFKEIEI